MKSRCLLISILIFDDFKSLSFKVMIICAIQVFKTFRTLGILAEAGQSLSFLDRSRSQRPTEELLR